MAPYPTTILLASDGSPDARLAEQIAADLGRRSGAALHVVHAWRDVPVGPYPYPALTPATSYQLFKETAEQLLAASVDRIATAGGTVAGSHLRNGSPARAIVAIAAEIAADLLIIGSRGHGTLRRLVVGSVSEEVVHRARCPLLVVRGGAAAWPPARIVVGDDGSADAARAATLGAELARRYEAPLTLARAVPDLPALPWYDAGQRAAVAKMHADVLARSRDELAAAARCLAAGGIVTPALAIAAGDPAVVILGVAEAAQESTLIALGCRGLGPFDRLRLGSVSTKLLHAARGPLLIAPRADGEG